MHVYILNRDFVETGLIESYISLIWTERYDTVGDFELHVSSADAGQMDIGEGTVLSVRKSKRMMVVETIREVASNHTVVYSGRSLESILSARVAKAAYSGSSKTKMYRGVRDSAIDGIFDSSDTLPGLKMGINEIYPFSTIPPFVLPASEGHPGWFNVGATHEDSGIGYRIVREQGSSDLYYDNYTGNDRSVPGDFDVSARDLRWPNPHMFEADDDIEVWRNWSNNPGFEGDFRPFTSYPIEGYPEQSGVTPRNVQVEWSQSGRGLEVASSSNRTGDLTQAVITEVAPNMGRSFDGRTLWGRTFTITCKIELKAIQSGLVPGALPRGVLVYTGSGANWNRALLASVHAPNSVGVHDVSVTFTVPTQGNANGDDRLTVMLTNRNGVDDEGIIFGDLCIVELPSNPVGYFDGNHSPDPDLLPQWLSAEHPSRSVLTGRKIAGVNASDMIGCVLVQSTQWGTDGYSARMIRNTTVSPHYVMVRMPDVGDLRSRGFLVTQYQSEVLTGTNSNFGRVYLRRGTNTRATGNAKANTVAPRNVSLASSLTYDRAELHGGYTQLGGSLYFDMLRATQQTTWAETPNEAVIFAEGLESFVVSDSRLSISDYRSVAYVTHGDLMVKVDDGYADGPVNRRVIHVDASDLENDSSLHARMEDLGKRALRENQRSFVIDGSVPSYSPYEYDVDYFLGDIVMVQNRSGRRMTARVVEQIFVSDKEGFRTYPTLREERSVGLGTWFAPEYNITWNASDHLGEWADQP